MSSVGLFYVGAVLVVNGVMLLGRIGPRETVPLNLFVGSLQVLTPFVLLLRADTTEEVLAAAPIYLFGFTYLWVGLNNLFDWPGGGLGWFSGFVALSALGMAAHQAFVVHDGPFTVIWLCWAVLWALFFLVLALDQAWLTVPTGWIAILMGLLTAAVPGALLVLGRWSNDTTTASVIAVIALVGGGAALTQRGTAQATAPPVPDRR